MVYVDIDEHKLESRYVDLKWSVTLNSFEYIPKFLH